MHVGTSYPIIYHFSLSTFILFSFFPYFFLSPFTLSLHHYFYFLVIAAKNIVILFLLSFSLSLFFSSTHCESCRVFFCYTLESRTSEAKCDTDSTAAQEMLQRSFAPCSPLLSWCIRGMTGPKQDVGRLNVYDKSA